MSHAPGRQAPRQLHLNINILHSGFVPSAWRVPQADPYAFIDVGHYIRVAQIAEAAKFDAVFLADNASIADQIGFRPITALEPTVLLASIAAATSRIGVIGTASTSYNEPYNIARRFSTLDHVSAGRAGWNVVTTADLGSARNFGCEAVPDHTVRPSSPSSSKRCGIAGKTTRSLATRPAGISSTVTRSIPSPTTANILMSRGR
jgi:Luciferase-like monooxygenase